MARVHPALARVPKPGPGELLTEDERDHRVRLKLQQLAEKREALRRAGEDGRRAAALQRGDARAPYETVPPTVARGLRRGGGGGLDGTSARDGHLRRDWSGPERNRRPGHGPSPVDVT